MKKTLLIGLLFFSIQSISQTPVTQAILNTGGGTATISPSFSVDWSIGESASIETYYVANPFSNSIAGINWNVTSGLLQPFDKTHLTYNFLIPAWTTKEIRFYPVPTPGIVLINFRSVITGKISIQLLNRDLKLLDVKEFIQINSFSNVTWDLSHRLSGTYYFRILLYSSTGYISKQGTFKVEKIK